MLRIPNPGSDIAIFIRIFRELYEDLCKLSDFDLDDITRAMINRSNVTSQGAIGEEALRRSSRADRSRDPLYNQSKMYAELFRTLGWIQSTTSALRFSISLLGEHVAAARNPKALVRECLLGLAYPNDVLEVKGDQSVRIFATILRTMGQLDGKISRDEMIAGPLNMNDDQNSKSFSKMINMLTKCRAREGDLGKIIKQMEKECGITKTTMENYTRFPIAALQWAGWAEKRGGYFHLTALGKQELSRLSKAMDVRLSDFRKFPAKAHLAFVRYAFFTMLGRSNFDLSSVKYMLSADSVTLKRSGCLPQGDILFSPFQQITREETNNAFRRFTTDGAKALTREAGTLHYDKAGDEKRVKPMMLMFEIRDDAILPDDHTKLLSNRIKEVYCESGEQIDICIERLADSYSKANKEVFYPLVTNLLRLIGFSCQMSRQGVNYERADAMIIAPDGSIPLEIKSPGEENEISVKAVRQAFENKIVLLSRKNYPGVPETTSLVIGFNPPNKRSEVHELITDIYKAFNISIGVIDIRSLLHLAVICVVSERKINIPQFKRIRGVIRVSRITASR